VHPRLQSGACARPLNFTVRSRFREWKLSEELEISRSAWPRRDVEASRLACQQGSSLDRAEYACGSTAFDGFFGRAPRMGPMGALFDLAPGPSSFGCRRA